MELPVCLALMPTFAVKRFTFGGNLREPTAQRNQTSTFLTAASRLELLIAASMAKANTDTVKGRISNKMASGSAYHSAASYFGTIYIFGKPCIIKANQHQMLYDKGLAPCPVGGLKENFALFHEGGRK